MEENKDLIAEELDFDPAGADPWITGESYLDELYHRHTGRHFSHHVHSVRVLDRIFPLNVSLQTLDGILGHNGEIECEEIRPVPLTDFATFDNIVENCYEDKPWTAPSISAIPQRSALKT